jgi:signal transduction histidine kinase
LLTSVVDFLRTQAEKKAQSLTLELPGSPLPEIGADPIALESIFGNLITNAIKCTPQGGEIAVKAEMSGLSIRITVSDNGFGIEEKDLEKIFDRFYRIKDDNTRFINGTGLGLPIVKGLLDSLGGFIEVDSVPGKGSTFTILIPVTQAGGK